MTEDEKYEIATLASEVSNKRATFEAHAIMATPTDPMEREKALAAYMIARAEFYEALVALDRAQERIANKVRS